MLLIRDDWLLLIAVLLLLWKALRDGVFDVLPENCLQSLTSEDLRLLLNGVGDIDVATLISYTTFNDESNEGSDKLLKFKRWFWSIVEKMNAMERQDLVGILEAVKAAYVFVTILIDYLSYIIVYLSL